MGFLDRLFGPSVDGARLEPHRERAGETAAELLAAARLDAAERRLRLRQLPATDGRTLVSLAVVLADALRRDDAARAEAMAVLARLARTPLPFAPDDVRLLVDLAAGARGLARRRIVSVATAGAEGLSTGRSQQVGDTIDLAIDLLSDDAGQEAARLRGRLLALAPAAAVRRRSFDMVASGDMWSARVRPQLEYYAGDRTARALLELMAALHRTEPTLVWQRRCAELVNASEGRVVDLVATLLGAMVDLAPTRSRPAVGPANADLLRGAVWAATIAGDPSASRLLVDAGRSSDEAGVAKVANACLAGLGRLAGDEAVAELAARWWSERRRGARRTIEQALAAAGRRRGETPSTLLEPYVPTRSSSRVLRDEVRRIDVTLTEDRCWDLPMWTKRFFDHPVTGPLARLLVWSLEESPMRWTAMPGERSGSFRLADDSIIEPSMGAAFVRPWHPLFADEVEVMAWREHVARQGVHQPVEQVVRPVFLPGTDEPPAAAETSRFTERQVDGRALLAALERRGWNAKSPPFRAWPAGERVELQMDWTGGGHVRIGAMRFSVPIGELPPMVFSEAIRDVDRMIGAAELRG